MSKLFDEALGELIKEYRLKKGLIQDDVGRVLNVSYQQIQKYEKGINELKAKNLCMIFKTLEIPLTHLVDLVKAAPVEILPSKARGGTKLLGYLQTPDNMALEPVTSSVKVDVDTQS